MLKPTLNAYLQLLASHPNPCIHGMGRDFQENFNANRKSLEVSYDAFLLCRDWLSKARLSGLNKISVRCSIELKHEIEPAHGRFIPLGTVLAAAMFHGMTLCDEVMTRSSAAND
jgi:hypothetical protein